METPIKFHDKMTSVSQSRSWTKYKRKVRYRSRRSKRGTYTMLARTAGTPFHRWIELPKELKSFYHGTLLASPLTTLKTTPSVTDLCIIRQGTGANQRVGSKVLVKSILIKGYVEFVPTTDAAIANVPAGGMSISLVLDTQVNGIAPGFLEIFKDNSRR